MSWAKVGGYDLVGMTGVILGAASCGLPVVLDGFLSYASALACLPHGPVGAPLSYSFTPVGGERSADRPRRAGSAAVSRYGHAPGREGSGAALAMHLLDAASVMYNQMGTLAQSNIVLPDSAPSS